MSYTAYKFSQHTTNDTRDVEYRLLAQVTARLLDLKDKRKNADLAGKRDMVDAILWNRDIWNALKVDLSSDGNQLPAQLRASLISIAIWVEKECMKIVDDKGDLEAIIEVNRNIMAGLKPHNDHAEKIDETDSLSSYTDISADSFVVAV